MKMLITTHAQMFRTPDGAVWTRYVYGYDFFKRYLDVFEEVRLVTRMKDIDYEEAKDKIRVDGKGLEFYSLPFYHGPWQYAVKYCKIQSSLSSAIEGCDCAVLRIPEPVSFQLFSKIKKREIPCAIEVVSHAKDLYAPGTIKTIVRPFLRIMWNFLQKRVCRLADGVSYVTREYIQQSYPSKIKEHDTRRFETYYNDANLDEIFFSESRTAQSFENRTINLVHVAGINNTAKGHYELLHVLSEIKDDYNEYRLIFVGGGTMLNYYSDLRDELGLNEYVMFKGHVSAAGEIADILKASDIFILPTYTEGLPRVILEAMASGLPCIASDVGGISEILSQRSLIKPKSIISLKDKLLEFSHDSELLAQESKRNREEVTLYCKDIITSRQKSFYMKLREIANNKCIYDMKKDNEN